MADFPVFQDGDVEIRLSRKPEDRYVLHSIVLSLHSSFFKASLSERWSGLQRDSAPSGSIKWRYQLQFGADEQDSAGVPLPSRTKEEALPYLERSNISADTASIILEDAPWAPSEDTLTDGRINVIVAYRGLFRLMFHEPIDWSIYNFEEVVHVLRRLHDVADACGSLALLKVPVELALRPFQPRFGTVYREESTNLLFLAIATRSKWLFREVVCRLIGDAAWTDDRINALATHFAGVAPLILSKRKELCNIMQDVERNILLMLTPVKGSIEQSSTLATALGIAAYRELVVTRFFMHQHQSYFNEKFLLLTRWPSTWSTEQYDMVIGPFGSIPGVRPQEIKRVVNQFFTEAAYLVDPLLKSVLQKDDTPLKGSKEYLDQGFICTDISDDDLPWNDST